MKLREALQMKLNGEVEDIILTNINGIHRLPHLDYVVEVTYPKPQTETVEVKWWFCTECGCNQGYQGTNRCCNKELVELTGTYEWEIKRKVKRRGVYGGAIYANGVLKVNDPCDEIPVGKPLILKIEWGE